MLLVEISLMLSKSNNKYRDHRFFMNNIFDQFGGLVFEQTNGILLGIYCAPLLANLFLHAYEADIIQPLLKNKCLKLAQTLNSSFRYICNVMSLNFSRFGDYLHPIYPSKLEGKDTTDIQKSASFLDIHLEIDKGCR
jgi:hypothetical protein